MDKKRRGRFGKYLPGLFTLADLVIVNGLFAVTLLLCGPLPSVKTLWVLVNTSYLPVMLWLKGNADIHRQVLMDHVVCHSCGIVATHALVFCTLSLFLNVGMPLRAYAVYYGMMLVALPLWWVASRSIVKSLRRRGYNFLRVVIVGTGPTATRLYEELQSDAGFGYKVLGFFSDEPAPGFSGNLLGDIGDLERMAEEYDIDEVYYTLSGAQEDKLGKVVKIADKKMMTFYYVPQISRRLSRSFRLHSRGVVPVLSIRETPLEHPFNQWLKRGFDIAFSSVVLLFSPIVFVPVAIAIKLTSPGPIFFKQERTGYKGETFRCWKFRTMRVNKGADSQQASADDPRTTRLGHFLRHTSIDELPQFVNVWLGQMSVVGPRPHMLKHTEEYAKLIDLYMVRHSVKPGITGWAQVNGYRGPTEQLWKMEKRVEYDVWYVENWTFLLDMKIIVRTLINAVSGEENAC